MNEQRASNNSDEPSASEPAGDAATLSSADTQTLLQTIADYEKKLAEQVLLLQQMSEAAKSGEAALAQSSEDLQKCRRQLEIEAALETVRSRTMAIKHSNELAKTACIVLTQLKQLGENPFHFSIGIVNEDQESITFWITDGEEVNQTFQISINEPHVINRLYSAWKEQNRSVTFSVVGKYLQNYLQHSTGASGFDSTSDVHDTKKQYIHAAFFSEGIITFSTLEKRPPESLHLLERFADVFHLTYNRFLSLQHAEAAAKEARTEAALERVRSCSMAMRTSGDVSAAIGLLFTELEKLGITTLRCGIFIIDDKAGMLEVWTAVATENGRVGRAGGWFPVSVHPMIESAISAWREKQSYYTYELAGEELQRYFKMLQASNPGYTLPAQSMLSDRQYSSGFFFNEGAVFTFTAAPLAPESITVLKRFAAVFELTYRRFLDLKIAEEQNRQLVKQASLDRLQASIASMRSAADLQRVTPLVWRELTTLQVPFVRCGVFIVDEVAGLIHAYLSTPAGTSRGVIHMPIDNREHIQRLLIHWRNKSVYTDHWNHDEFMQWMEYLNSLREAGNTENYFNEAEVPEALYLHFVPFAQGLLYVGNLSPLAVAELQLVHSLTDAFAIAYSRYEDFRQLEEAKNKLEATVAELRTTQRQLIQSEKMASLGELTAGIAHEIQNPLNFVTNFSDIAGELMREMEEALQNGEIEEAGKMAEEIKQNLHKIGHHGRRADSIVKGMLQHSRHSNGQKLPTDINALVEEYLRLSYHGFRASDKSFNAAIQTRFDERIGEIEVVPQDLGRVLLNLFNNAFYAVHEKKKEAGADYKPTIQVMTRLDDDKVKIRVKDNGSGISAKAMEKIFHPFFTTKPAGAGTGLGLSISYDIVKMHGGELKVKSTEGEETEFTIVLNKKDTSELS
jgi:signal transduction histidine kinase